LAWLLGACNALPQQPPIGSGVTHIFGPSIADLINTRAGAPLGAPPEPKLIALGGKTTLVYTARHARTEILREAVSGLLNPDGTIQDSAALNALVVQDQTDVVKNILTVLQALDTPTPQLLVEARIVEVTLTDDLEYEITHTLTIPNSPGAFFQNTDIALNVPGTPTANQGASIHIRPWASTDINLDNFVRLLETRGKANILSSPNVIVAPGTEASIITGEEVPIQSTTVVSGSLTTNTVFKRVGIKLRVALQQITNDTARLDINPEVSTVTGFTQVSQGVTNPIISLRNVSSTVSLKDGEILTIGGLLQDEDTLTTHGIPVLQDIPKAGVLFQSRRDTKTKTQLIFFLRVHILPEGMPGAIRLHNPGEGMQQMTPDTQPGTSGTQPVSTQPGSTQTARQP
jgi:type II secretory pathway component GspD/PulD (secretin)